MTDHRTKTSVPFVDKGDLYDSFEQFLALNRDIVPAIWMHDCRPYMTAEQIRKSETQHERERLHKLDRKQPGDADRAYESESLEV